MGLWRVLIIVLPVRNLQPPPNVDFVSGMCPFVVSLSVCCCTNDLANLQAILVSHQARIDHKLPSRVYVSGSTDQLNQLNKLSSGYRGSSAFGGSESEVGTHRVAQGGDVARWWAGKHFLRLRRAQSCQPLEHVR